MYLVKAYIFNRNCRDQYFYAESWKKVMQIFKTCVDIDAQEKYIQTIEKRGGIIVSAKLHCDEFQIEANRIEEFSEFEFCKNKELDS